MAPASVLCLPFSVRLVLSQPQVPGRGLTLIWHDHLLHWAHSNATSKKTGQLHLKPPVSNQVPALKFLVV